MDGSGLFGGGCYLMAQSLMIQRYFETTEVQLALKDMPSGYLILIEPKAEVGVHLSFTSDTGEWPKDSYGHCRIVVEAARRFKSGHAP